MIFWNSRSRGLNNWALNVGKLLRTRDWVWQNTVTQFRTAKTHRCVSQFGVPILLGVSRKGMIKTISGAEQAADRAPGSIAVALAARAKVFRFSASMT